MKKRTIYILTVVALVIIGLVVYKATSPLAIYVSTEGTGMYEVRKIGENEYFIQIYPVSYSSVMYQSCINGKYEYKTNIPATSCEITGGGIFEFPGVKAKCEVRDGYAYITVYGWWEYADYSYRTTGIGDSFMSPDYQTRMTWRQNWASAYCDNFGGVSFKVKPNLCIGVTCYDGDPCTQDTCDPNMGCKFIPISPCCGNGICETEEKYSTCPSVCKNLCEGKPNEICVGLTRKYGCDPDTGDYKYSELCNDNNNCTIDS
ncbi:MAG: hypothetical protein DRJ64_09240, partial [Thermoprotei archaeon]